MRRRLHERLRPRLYLHHAELGQHMLRIFGAPECLFADLDANELVNIDDLLLLIGTWGPTGPGDSNGDGATDIVDVLNLIALWGDCTP